MSKSDEFGFLTSGVLDVEWKNICSVNTRTGTRDRRGSHEIVLVEDTLSLF